jgi:signal transduction histidine kinase
VSLRVKVILPYLLLTLAVAIIGTYVVTRLVASSLTERLTNQLLEAGRVVSDGMARQEIGHLEAARVVAYTSGLGDALAAGDVAAVTTLAEPVAAGLDIESLTLVNLQGQEMLNLLQQADGSYVRADQPTSMAALWVVQNLIEQNDVNALPARSLGQHPLNGRYYYFTAIPVEAGGRMAGVVVLGTSLDTLLPYLKSTALADVVFFVEDGRSIATTLGGADPGDDLLAQLAISPESYDAILRTNDLVTGENTKVFSRWYSLARGPLKVGSDRLGVFAVALPLNFVLQAGADSRNMYVLIFSLAMIGVVLIGYFIAQIIIGPLSRLVRASQAIAGGDLSQRTGIRNRDEIGVLAVTFDEMTENLEARTHELQKAYHSLAQMDRTKSTFITLAAHELRTPLTLISGYTQMLKESSEKDEELLPLAVGVLDGTKRMSEVVNSMLDVSRIDNQTLEIVPEQFGVAMLLERVHSNFAQALKSRNLSLLTEELYDLPPIQADPEQFYKVFYHLVMNAIKYTPDGGTITVSGRVVIEPDDRREVEIVVRDTGIGIDAEHQELIFEKFYQLGEVQFHTSSKTKFKGGGPGLGLSIARGIVLAHGGRIWVESAGHDEQNYPGSSFYIRLPLKEESA